MGLVGSLLEVHLLFRLASASTRLPASRGALPSLGLLWTWYMARAGSGKAQTDVAEAQLCNHSHWDAVCSFLAKALGRARTPWGGEGASVASSVKQTSPAPLTRIDHTLEHDTPIIMQSGPEQGASQYGLH